MATWKKESAKEYYQENKERLRKMKREKRMVEVLKERKIELEKLKKEGVEI